jgi:hypothetical protein
MEYLIIHACYEAIYLRCWIEAVLIIFKVVKKRATGLVTLYEELSPKKNLILAITDFLENFCYPLHIPTIQRY